MLSNIFLSDINMLEAKPAALNAPARRSRRLHAQRYLISLLAVPSVTDIDQLISIKGMIIRTSAIIPNMKEHEGSLLRVLGLQQHHHC